MFSLSKKFIAGTLIVAIIITNSGISTLASAVPYMVSEAQSQNEENDDLTSRYYEEVRYSYEYQSTYLMNDVSESEPEVGAGITTENSDASDTSGGSGEEETTDIDFDVQKNDNENIEIETTTVGDESEAESKEEETTVKEEDTEKETTVVNVEEESKEETASVNDENAETETAVTSTEEESKEETASVNDENTENTETETAVIRTEEESKEETTIENDENTEIETTSNVSSTSEMQTSVELDEIKASTSNSKLLGNPDHMHKPCGVTGECLHGANYPHADTNPHAIHEYEQIWGKRDITSAMESGGSEYYFYIENDTGATQRDECVEVGAGITINICLNRHVINGWRFTGEGRVIITDCSGSGTGQLTNYNYYRRIALGWEERRVYYQEPAFYDIPVEIYGTVENGVTVKAPALLKLSGLNDATTSTKDGNCYFYNTLFTRDYGAIYATGADDDPVSEDCIQINDYLYQGVVTLENVNMNSITTLPEGGVIEDTYSWRVIHLWNENVTVNIKNTVVDNFKAFQYRFIENRKGNMNFYGNNVIRNSANEKWERFASVDYRVYPSFIHNHQDGNMTIVDGSLTIDSNDIYVEKIVHQDGDFIVATGSSLIINNNTINDLSYNGAGDGSSKNFQSVFLIKEDYTYIDYTWDNTASREIETEIPVTTGDTLFYGNVEITNNLFKRDYDSETQWHHNVHDVMRVETNKTIKLGSGHIILTENTTNDEGRDPHLYCLVSTTTDNETPIFTQEVGKFSKDTEIEGVTFINAEESCGIILKSWKKNAEERNSYVGKIVADLENITMTSGRTIEVCITAGNLIVGEYVEEHAHKACGVDIATPCEHDTPHLNAHFDEINYIKFDSSIRRLEDGVGYFLTGDVELTNTVTVVGKSYLCLNGFSLTGTEVIQASNTAVDAEIYVCNCKDVEVNVGTHFVNVSTHIFGTKQPINFINRTVITGDRTGRSYSAVPMRHEVYNIKAANDASIASTMFSFYDVDTATLSNILVENQQESQWCIFGIEGNVKIYNTTITNTEPARDGLIETGNNANLWMEDCVIESNIMPDDASLINIINNAKAYFTNVRIVNNSGSKPIFKVNSAEAYLENVLVDGNNVTQILSILANGKMVATNSSITNNTVTTNISEGSYNMIDVSRGSLTLYGDIDISNNDATMNYGYAIIGLDGYYESELNIKNGCTLNLSTNSVVNGDVFSVGQSGSEANKTINIEEDASVIIRGNNISCNDRISTYKTIMSAFYVGPRREDTRDGDVCVNVNGSLIIENNTFRSTYTGTNEISAAALAVKKDTTRINIGNKKIYVKKLKTNDETSTSVDNYGVYSYVEGFMTQIEGTTFNTENYFEDVALLSGKGVIMPETNFILAESAAKASFKASTLKNAGYYVTKGENNSVIITELEPHIHKICGTATDSICDHDNLHLPTHTKVIIYEELTNDMTTLEIGKGYYLTESSDPSINRIFTIPDPIIGTFDEYRGTVFICLNGYTLNNVSFVTASGSKNTRVFICNCSENEATIVSHPSPTSPFYIGDESGMFDHMGVSIYGTGNKINFKTRKFLTQTGGAYEMPIYIYNAHFSPVDGYINNTVDTAIYKQTGSGHVTAMSNVIFEGYTTTSLIYVEISYGLVGDIEGKFGLFNSKIINNNITGNGIIYTYSPDCDLTIENVVFENNNLSSRGFGIYQNGSNAKIVNISSISFINTNAGGTAAGELIVITNGNVNISSSSIINNKVDKLIHESGGIATFSNVRIEGNTTQNYLVQVENATTELYMQNIDIIGNKNINYCMLNYGIVNINNMLFENNDTTGSTAHSSIMSEKTVVIDNSILRNNETNASLIKSGSGATLTVKNTKIHDNTMTQHVIHNGADDTSARGGNLYIENVEIYNHTLNSEASIIRSDHYTSAVSMNISGNNYIHDNTAYYIITSKLNSNNNFDNGTTIIENNTIKYAINIQNYNLNINETATVSVLNNTIERVNTNQGVVTVGQLANGYSPRLNLRGNLYITNNNFVGAESVAPTTMENTPAGLFMGATTKMNLGNGVLKVYGNTIDNDTHRFNKLYQMFSKATAGNFINQIDGTTFNEETFVDGIGFISGKGNIMATGFTKDNSVIEKSFIAATYSSVFSDGMDYKAYKGNSNNIVIGVRKVNLDFNAPEGKTVNNSYNYPTSINIGGKTKIKLDLATFEVTEKEFLGWAYASNSEIADISDGGEYETLFGTSDISQTFTLYAIWGSGDHIHKICGVASNSECDHDIAHLSAHTTVVKYEKLLDTMTTLENGKGYFLASSSDASVSRTFTISGTVYICLNGHTLNNVSFARTSDGDAVYICNCKAREASMTQNTSTYMFNHISTYMYGNIGKINLTTKRIGYRVQNTEMEFYNVHFTSIDGFVHTDNGTAILGKDNNVTDTTAISNCTFENYKTTVLISNNSTAAVNSKTKIYNTKFINNEITYRGLIYNNGGEITLENVEIDGTTVGTNGTIIYQHQYAGTINIASSSITNTNSGGSNNGIIFNNAVGSINISNTKIDNNKSNYFVNSQSGSINIDDTEITNNTSGTNFILNQSSSVMNVHNAKISGNNVWDSLVWATGGSFNIYDSEVANNIMTNHNVFGASGAAILASNSYIHNNTMTNGAQLILSEPNSNMTFNTCRFVDNILKQRFANISRATVNMNNTNIINNDVVGTYTGGDGGVMDFIYVHGYGSNNSYINFSGNCDINYNDAVFTIIYADIRGNIIFKNGSNININHNSVYVHKILAIGANSRVDIEENAIVNMKYNEVILSNDVSGKANYQQGVLCLEQANPVLNIYGDLNITDNVATGSTIKTNYSVGGIIAISTTTARVNLGNGKLIVKDNKSHNDIDVHNHMFGMYSVMPNLIYQMSGTTFNEENYIEDIAIGDDAGVLTTGNIMPNNNFTKDNSVATKSFIASTFSNIDYRAYKGKSDNVVIGIRKINFDFNAPTGITVATNNYATYKNIAGDTVSKIDRATFKAQGYAFIGWTKERKEPSLSGGIKPDVIDGGSFETAFDSGADIHIKSVEWHQAQFVTTI